MLSLSNFGLVMPGHTELTSTRAIEEFHANLQLIVSESGNRYVRAGVPQGTKPG